MKVYLVADPTERARRVLSKLRQTARLIQAARDNVKDPPGIYVKVAIETFRGTLTFIERDLPRAFSGVDDLHLLGDLADASTEAATAIHGYVEFLEREHNLTVERFEIDKEGLLKIPDRPGLGVRLDPDKLKRYRGETGASVWKL